MSIRGLNSAVHPRPIDSSRAAFRVGGVLPVLSPRCCTTEVCFPCSHLVVAPRWWADDEDVSGLARSTRAAVPSLRSLNRLRYVARGSAARSGRDLPDDPGRASWSGASGSCASWSAQGTAGPPGVANATVGDASCYSVFPCHRGLQAPRGEAEVPMASARFRRSASSPALQSNAA